MTAIDQQLPTPPERLLEAGRALNATIIKMGRSKPEQKAWLDQVKALSPEDFHRVYDWGSTGLDPIGNDIANGGHLEASLLGRAIQCRMEAVLTPTMQAYIQAHGKCPSYTDPAFQATTPDGHSFSLSPASFYVAIGGDKQVKVWVTELEKSGNPLTQDITEDLFHGIAFYAKNTDRAPTATEPASEWRWDAQSVHDRLSKVLPSLLFFSAILAAMNRSETVQSSTLEMLSYQHEFGNAAAEGFARIVSRSSGKDLAHTAELLRTVIASGIDLMPAPQTQSLLHRCAIDNHVTNALILLEAGHDPLHVDDKGFTPLEHAASRPGSTQTAEVFRAWLSKAAALDAIAEIGLTKRKASP